MLGKKIKRGRFEEPVFIMTVDVDSWSSLLNFYSLNYDPLIADAQVNVEEGLNKILQLFDKHGVKATFFVPGEVARQHARAIKEIYESGHEIACHGLMHKKNEFLGTIQEQERVLREATWIIQKIIGCRPIGFRAPCLQFNSITLHVLEKLGYFYDSSVVPTFVPGYYGFLFAPKRAYHPSHSFISKEGSYRLLELPISVNPLIPLPLSAAWMRNFGLSWVKFGIKINFILGYPVVFYVHPRDIVFLPKLKGVPWHLYRNVGFSGFKMLSKIIDYAKQSNARFMRAVDFANYWKFSLKNLISY